jgi:hypothetical protein
VKWSSLNSLSGLALNNNSLSGTLPVEWNYLTSLGFLVLSDNHLSGTLPVKPPVASSDSLRAGYNITSLDLRDNNLSGTLPVQWSSLGVLTGEVGLLLSTNSLSGPLPAEWSTLSNLIGLTLDHNNLSGPLPLEWSLLTNLTHLDLSSNNLSGPLPAQWSSLSHLVVLDLAWNQLLGKLPSEWHHLQTIALANLSCQRGEGFSGGMPPSWRRWCAMTPPPDVWSFSGIPLVHNIDFTWCKSPEACAEICAWQGLSASLYSNQQSCIMPKGIKDTRLPSNESFWQGLKWSWREDGCRYPYAFEALVGLMVMLPVLLICMFVVGIILRQIARRQLRANQASSSQLLGPYWLRNTLG